MINDKSSKVRLSFVSLLVRISSIRSIHFYDIVPIGDLHQRLVVDRDIPAIASKLTLLLLRSYFPQVCADLQ